MAAPKKKVLYLKLCYNAQNGGVYVFFLNLMLKSKIYKRLNAKAFSSR